MAEAEFPSNSQTQREAHTRPAAKTPPKAEKKKITQITEGEVIRKKPSRTKRLKEIFFGGDARGALGFVAMDVLVPAAKDMIADAGREAIERMVFGDTRRSRGYRSEGPTRYSGNYRPMGGSWGAPPWRSEPQREMSRTARSQHRFDELFLSSRGEAERVIDTLQEIVEQYNQATVADLYELVGITSAYTDHKYGWTDLRGSRVQHSRGGTYLLDLPKPEPLD